MTIERKVRSRKKSHERSALAWTGLGLVILGIGAAVFLWLMSSSQEVMSNPQTAGSGLRAVIIDQLSQSQPDAELISRITRQMQAAGYQVDLCQGEEVTVNYYRHLADRNYALVFIRSHSGVILNRTRELESSYGTYLFTNEPYNALKYTAERIKNEVIHAAIREGQPQLFAVGAEFIRTVMAGSFESTVVILDGCHGLYYEDLARAFIEKGAAAYLAWNASVRLEYVDPAAGSLIENLLVKKLSVSQAVEAANAENGKDRVTGAWLKYYPLESGDLRIASK